MRIILICCFSFFFSLNAFGYVCSAKIPNPTDYEKKRAKLLSNIISKQLSENHYSKKVVNDELSQEAFQLYLKQLDPQKRFFLQKDIDYLNRYIHQLDDQIISGIIEFPIIVEELLQQRVITVKRLTDQIFSNDFNFDKNDIIETDSKKLSYCRTEVELRERWRVNLKYQVISRYLTMLEDEKAKDVLAQENGGNKNDQLPEKQKTDNELRKEAKEKILKSHDNFCKRICQRTVEEKYDRFFSIISRAFDPHSDFMAPTKKEDFDIHMRGSLEGIGAVLQEEDGYIKVMRIVPGGAAYRQKELEAEDLILMVAQGTEEPVEIIDMRIRDAVSLIRGKKGTEVRLTIKKPDGMMKNIAIIRDVIQLEETFVKNTVLKSEVNNISYGYIKIPSFYRDFQTTRNGGQGRNVTDDVHQSLDELKRQDIKGLIIDLRNNGGGALVDAVKTAGLFIKSGPIVKVKNSQDQADVLYDYDSDIYYQGPMVVLINKFSASASEILAGALQDYKRAIIIGSDHTYGKGTVQTVINLDDNVPFLKFNMAKFKPLGALKVTTQKFYRINGESTQHRGVVPDIVLPDRYKYMEIGEQYIENSLEWDKISAETHNNWPQSPNFGTLKRLSAKRIETNEQFLNIKRDAEEVKRRQEKTTIEVNISKIREENQKLKEMQKNIYHNEESDYSEANNGTDHPKTGQDKEKDNLVDQLQHDPYIEESLSLLRDISS